MNKNLNLNGAPLYGLAYQNLQTKLFKQHKYSEMRLSTYLSARMGVENWTFSSADIANQTGLNRNTVYALCSRFVEAGIFALREERRGCPTIYSYDKSALLKYLQGDTAIDGFGEATCTPNTHLPACSNSTSTCSTDKHGPATSTSTSCLSDKHEPACPTGPINNNKKEERIKTHKQEACVCSSSLSLRPTEETLTDASLSAKAKTDGLLNYVRYLNSLDAGFMLSDKAETLALRFFKAYPTKAVSELTNLIEDCISLTFGLKPHDSGYDEYFNIRRSHNLSYLLDHLEATTNEVNSLKGQLGV